MNTQRPPVVRTDLGNFLRWLVAMPFIWAAICFAAAIPFGILVEIGVIGS